MKKANSKKNLPDWLSQKSSSSRLDKSTNKYYYRTNMSRLRTYWPVLLIALAFILIGVFAYRNMTKTASVKATPAPSPTQTEVPQFESPEKQTPKFNLTTYKCSNFNYTPTPTDNFDPSKYTWQTSAPRENGGKIKINQQAEIGLRNKLGKAGEELKYKVQIHQPNGAIVQGESTLKADQWATQQISATQTGIYTITYEVSGVPIACDGFEVIQ